MHRLTASPRPVHLYAPMPNAGVNQAREGKPGKLGSGTFPLNPSRESLPY